jgi:hypothetical protein
MLKQKKSKTKTKKTLSTPVTKIETAKLAAKVEKSQPAKAKSLPSKSTAKVEKSQSAKVKSLVSKSTAKMEKSQPAKVKAKPEDRTRLLLFLWDMGSSEVPKGELTEKLKRNKETATMYQPVFEQLDKDGAITCSTMGNAAKVSMMDKGMQMLEDGLKNPEFKFDGNQVGSNVANALLKWIGSSDMSVALKKETSKNKKGK